MDRKLFFSLSLSTIVVVGLAGLSGCGDPGTKSYKDADTTAKADPHAHEHGPHDGHIIELGHDHSLHAELVEDDDKKLVTVYTLDGDMKPKPIQQESVTINLTVDGEVKTYTLTAVDAKDGMASQFASDPADAELLETLDGHDVTKAQLSTEVDGKPVSGSIEADPHKRHDDDDDHHHGKEDKDGDQKKAGGDK